MRRVIGPRKLRKAKKTTEIGWREVISLPELGIPALKAKIDTGARTSALHAVDIETYERDGVPWVSFHVPLADRFGGKKHHTRIIDERRIRNTSGRMESRIIIESTLVLGNRNWRIEISLANRQNMELDLILGRTAVRRRDLLVNPGRSFLAGTPVGPVHQNLPKLDDGLLGALKRGKKTARKASDSGEQK